MSGVSWLEKAVHKLAWVAVLCMVGWTTEVLPNLSHSVVRNGQGTQSL